MAILEFVSEHWLQIVEGFFALIGVASVIVKLTPTPKDNEILKKIKDFVNKFIALNNKEDPFS